MVKFLEVLMTDIILPGEQVNASHAKLKLGPGLTEISEPSGSSKIVSTRAGIVKHSSNGSKWWVESNSRRVCQQPKYSY